MVVKLRAARSQMSNMYSSWLSIKVELDHASIFKTTITFMYSV